MKADAKTIRNILFFGFLTYLPVSLLFFAFSMFVNVQENHNQRANYIANETNVVSLENEIIVKNLGSLFSDISYLAYTFQNYEQIFRGENYKQLQENWEAFLASKKVYFKLRFIDVNGNEMIRVNYTEDGPYTSGAEELENKRDRYYFKDAIALGKDQIYMSRLDLNEEHGEIEQPLRPVIRFAVTVYDGQGNLEGMIVISYSANNLLTDFEDISSTSLGDVFLLNSAGHWLDNSISRGKEWAFMYENKSDISFNTEHPAVWQEINAKGRGVLISERGMYVYSSIAPGQSNTPNIGTNKFDFIVSAEEKWRIVSFIPSDRDNGIVFNDDIFQIALLTLNNQKLAVLLILILALGFGFLLNFVRSSKEKMRYYSFDPLTKVYNRRAGFELLEKTHRQLSKTGEELCVCFIDINGLKGVNDSLGHARGDELIRCVINVVKKCIRRSDFIIRIGGDEFLIIFVGAGVAQAEEIWVQICSNFKLINQTGNKPFIISVSHGIEACKFDINEFIDKIVNAADEKMYHEKRIVHANAK
jgi:diguanylate cyclase (GGDEF)-like protein